MAASTGAMQCYGTQMVTEDLHQHSRHLYGIQHRLQEPGASPCSEESAKSPQQVLDPRVRSPEGRFGDMRSPEPEGVVPRFRDEGSIGKRFRDQQEIGSVVQNRSPSPRRPVSLTGSSSSPQSTPNHVQSHNTGGKTSFCIDALLGKATSNNIQSNELGCGTDEVANPHAVINESKKGFGSPSSTLMRDQNRRSESPIGGLDPRELRGNSLHALIQHHSLRGGGSPGKCSASSQRQRSPGDPGILHQSGFRPDQLMVKYQNERLQDNTEDETSVDVDSANRNGSASPGSNASRSPASSPPISPGSEEPTGNGIINHQNPPPNPYGAVNPGVVRQNQGLLLHPGGPLIHPGGLYYHPAGGSAFHSIHKEGQPVGHPQSGAPHPQQHHIHPLQLEWLARTGMLYPRLPADLVGESITSSLLLCALTRPRRSGAFSEEERLFSVISIGERLSM